MKFTSELKIKNMILNFRICRIHTNFKTIKNFKGRMVTGPQTFEMFCPVLSPLFGVNRFNGSCCYKLLCKPKKLRFQIVIPDSFTTWRARGESLELLLQQAAENFAASRSNIFCQWRWVLATVPFTGPSPADLVWWVLYKQEFSWRKAVFFCR